MRFPSAAKAALMPTPTFVRRQQTRVKERYEAS